ncbi:MAG: YbbR-like domain-containing protein [Alkalispirochaetaceae bacterium]
MKSSLKRLLRNWPAKVLSFVAALMLLIFHNITSLEERFFSVPLELRLSEGLVPASDYPRQVQVRLRGDSEEIFRVVEENILAFADFREQTTEGEYRAAVRIAETEATARIDPLEINVEPPEISVVLEEKLIRSIEVEPTLSGFPPSGFELTNYQMNPSTVQVEGPESIVRNLEELATEEIDLAGKREDFIERVRIVRPDELIQFPGGNVVEFRGIIEESVVLNTFEPVEVVVLGLDPELELVTSLPNGLVRVQATQRALDQTSGTDVQLTVDASTIEAPGSYELRVVPQVPRGFVVLRFEPGTVRIRVAGVDDGDEGENEAEEE